ENLRVRDRDYLEDMERWFAVQATTGPASGAQVESGPASGARAVPPMFTPYRLRDMELVNRVVVSPMAMYSADNGTPGDFYLVHLGSRAQGGAGMVFTETTAVTPDGRITP